MGSWYDNLKPLKKPDWITIKPAGDGKLEVILQYNKEMIHQTIEIDEEVCFRLTELNVVVEKGERWGDWGGPIKCGDVILVKVKED